MKATFENLKKLEAKINRGYARCKNSEYFFESKRGSRYEQDWCELMIKLRGWDISRYDESGKDLTTQEWIDYCGTQLSLNYNLGDVCA